MSEYLEKLAKLIVFMFENGFNKEEVLAAVNAVRVLKDYEMIIELLDKKDWLPKKEIEQ